MTRTPPTALRILHTADWHVGRTIARRPRLAEHRDVLAEIAEVAVRREVDVVVVAGDLFDQQNPTAEAERVVYDALADLRDAVKHVVVVAGNHDSPRRWHALSRLAGSIHIVADVADNPKDHFVDIAFGKRRARIVCLPWVAEHRLPDPDGVAPLFRPGFAERLRDLAGGLVSAAGTDRPVIFVGHLHTAEATLGGGERPAGITPTLALPEIALPTSPDYTALGHIHGRQPVGSTGRAFYSGSVLQLDFAERNDAKGVIIAEVGEGAAAPEMVDLEKGTRLYRVTGTVAEIEKQVIDGAIPDGHIEVRVQCDGPEAGLGDRVRQLVPQCVAVRLDYPTAEAPERRSLKSLTLRDAFARYLDEKGGVTADAALLDRFEALLDDPPEDDVSDIAAA
jgi:DNA repair protein SbcD/Mre11